MKDVLRRYFFRHLLVALSLGSSLCNPSYLFHCYDYINLSAVEQTDIFLKRGDVEEILVIQRFCAGFIGLKSYDCGQIVIFLKQSALSAFLA